MRIPGVKTGKQFSHWVRARRLGGALILGYHRVALDTNDVHEICVTPSHFAEHLEILRKYTQPISLSRLVNHLAKDTLPAGSVAVTFDDGYADNLYHARPLLEKYEIPATVFICTGYLGREFWWDELERLVMSSEANLSTLQAQMGTKLFQSNQLSMNHEQNRAKSKFIRKKFFRALYHFLLSLDFEERETLIDIIRNWACLPPQKPITKRAMDHAELLQMSKGGLIELGSHTRNHPMLPGLSLERQRQEIFLGKQDLEELFDGPVLGFSYPNGIPTKEAQRIVREAGFAYACGSLHDRVRPGSDLYALARFWQQDVDGDKFMRGLRLWGAI